MWRHVVLASLALGGCDKAFMLDRDPVPIDAGCELPDEDNDCVTDTADNCPGVANPDQDDLLEPTPDGVGDACDPNPTRIGDRLVFFDGFTDPARSTLDWEDPSSNGKWRFSDGEAIHSDSTDNFALLQRRVAVTEGEVSIEAAFTFVAWGPFDPLRPRRLSLLVDSLVRMGSGHSCWFAPEQAAQTPGQDQAWLQEDGGSDVTSLRGIDHLEFEDAITLRLTRILSSTQITCAVTVAHGTAPQLPPVVQSGPWPLDRHVGISAANVAASVRYAAIYAVP